LAVSLLTGREQGHGGNDQGIFQGEHFRWTFSPNPGGGCKVPAKKLAQHAVLLNMVSLSFSVLRPDLHGKYAKKHGMTSMCCGNRPKYCGFQHFR
jgi:hypothetical protein